MFVAAGAGIEGFAVVGRMGCPGRRTDVFSRAGAGVDAIAFAQPIERGAVMVHALALVVRSEGPAAVRSFLPIESEPSQILDHGVDICEPETHGVEVFIAQYQDSCIGMRALPGDPECARVADVQITRGRRREPATITRLGRRTHGRELINNEAGGPPGIHSERSTSASLSKRFGRMPRQPFGQAGQGKGQELLRLFAQLVEVAAHSICVAIGGATCPATRVVRL